MPWFPEFFSAVELARRDTRARGSTDPVGQYFSALQHGDAAVLETAWPGRVTVHDPKAGEIHGHHKLRQFVRQNQKFLADRNARTQTVASTCVPGRAVVELLVQLDNNDDLQWPVAVVADSADDLSVVFRTYCSRFPVDGRRYIRPSILDSRQVQLSDVVARYLAALDAGDTEAAVRVFAANGYYREPTGSHSLHRGTAELRSFFASRLNSGGGIGIAPCAVTDDGTRCALEYNLVRWGRSSVTPQAGLIVCERGTDALLTAARVYDDVEPPDAQLPDAQETRRTATMEQAPSTEDPAERGLFETIKATYSLALGPEQHAMINQLRRMPTISAQEREALINNIENAVGQNLEDDVEF
jgi:hypothetical protein